MNKEYQTVGGIVYKLLQNPKANNTTDIIDLSSFSTMAHRPIKVEDTKIDGYTPQYQFRTETNTQTEERPITVEKPTSAPTPKFKIIQASNPRTPEKRVNLNINESLNDNERL